MGGAASGALEASGVVGGAGTSLLGMTDLSPQRDLNLCSAFAHVLADTMRTLTVMACALLVKLGGFDPQRTDAVGSLLVCAIIFVVAAFVAYETAAHCRRLRSAAPLAIAPSDVVLPALEAVPSEEQQMQSEDVEL